jgi:hypothetical protein
MGAGTFVMSGTYEQEVYGSGCNYYQTEGESPTAKGEGGSWANCSDGKDNDGDGLVDLRDPDCDSCRDGSDNDTDGLEDRGVDQNGDGDFDDPGEHYPEPGCLPGSCFDGINNDGDMNGAVALTDIRDPQCISNEVQDWSDLVFHADVPPGTSISFDMCTADTQAELATCGTLARIATVTSIAGSCANDAECRGVMVNGTMRDGFCGAGGQCQFITPPKRTEMGSCTTDAQCAALNGSKNGDNVYTYCDPQHRCVYTTPPADIGNNLPMNQNGKPYAKLRINMTSDPTGANTPTVFDWFMTYQCRAQN